MISTDFAPNESWDDALLSLKLLFQPWKWKSGNEVEKLKKTLSSIFQLPSSNFHLFLSGRSALYYLLKSFNLSPGSEVLIQAFTCEAVVLPILANDLKPIYLDIESEAYSMDFNSLTRKLAGPSKPEGRSGVNRKTNLTKVLILQHTFGLTPKDRDQILKLAKDRGLIVIEDLAHGFNPSIFKSSNIQHLTSNFYLLSFGRSKMLSSVFGGAIISSNRVISKLANQLTYPPYWFIFRCLLYKPLTMLIKSTYDFYVGKVFHKILNEFGLLIPEITAKEKSGDYDKLFNKAYPNALSMLLLHQLKKFDLVKEQRAKICNYYDRVILRAKPEGSLANARISNKLRDSSSAVHRTQNDSNILIRYPLLVDNRDEILTKARKQNIFLGVWYDQVVAPKDLDTSRVGYIPGSCPKAEEICQKIINLATNISINEAERVLNTLADVK